MALPTNPEELKIAKAKSALVLEKPFFATLCMTMPWERDDTIPTMATDGHTIFWSTEFVKEHTLDELKFVVCHEVLHCAFDHMGRMSGRDLYKWNVATDYVINQMLVDEGIGKMPKVGLLNPGIVQAGKGLAENVYNLLPDTPPSDQGGAFGQDGSSGKGSSGKSKPGPLDALRPRPGSPSEQAAAAADMKVRVAQAAQVAKMCGKLSAGLERFVNEVLRPKVPWREVLRDFFSTKTKTDRTWARPNRRFIAQGMYLPSLSGEAMGPILVAVDCSGSIGPKELAEFAAEIKAVHEDMRPTELHVYYFDSSISHTEQYAPDDTLDIRPHGGGGTAFAPIFTKAAESCVDFAACVVLTDGYCNDYGKAPDFPVLWTTTGDTKFPWGQVIEMKNC